MADKATKLKEQGTAAFQKKDYDTAIKYYGEAIALSKSDHLLYSNRSAAYAGAKRYEEALADGQKCVELKPDFAKGYGRVALAQFHLNKLVLAKSSYEEGLKHDSQNQALKTGLRDINKEFKSWFTKVVTEATESLSVTQQRISDASHRLVVDGRTNLSFMEAYEHMLKLRLPPDTLEEYGISEESCQETIARYENDYEVITAVQKMFAPSGKGDPERAEKITMSTIVDTHKFMETKMKKLVEEFKRLPTHVQHSIPKKDREHTAELIVSVAVESSFQIQGEDLEYAINMHSEELQGDAAFTECQTQIASQMQLLREPPFLMTRAPDAGAEATTSKTGAMTTTATTARNGAIVLGVLSALGLVVFFGLRRSSNRR